VQYVEDEFFVFDALECLINFCLELWIWNKQVCAFLACCKNSGGVLKMG